MSAASEYRQRAQHHLAEAEDWLRLVTQGVPKHEMLNVGAAQAHASIAAVYVALAGQEDG